MGRRKGSGAGWLTRRPNRPGGIWEIGFMLPDGRRYRESSGSRVKAEAQALLDQRRRELAAGTLRPLAARAVTYRQIRANLLRDYRINGRSLRQLETALVHLDAFFGDDAAEQITPSRIRDYVDHRLQTVSAKTQRRPANATVNRELAYLRRMFTLAEAEHVLPKGSAPDVPILEESAPRTGFVEYADYEALLRAWPEPALRPALVIAYITGWRVESEILTRRWRHVEWQTAAPEVAELPGVRGRLRLDPGEAKDRRRGRTFPLVAPIRAALEDLREAYIRTHGTPPEPDAYLFPGRAGHVKSLRGPWKKACESAGLRRIPHDFRRTAIRNLLDMGIPWDTVKRLVGHRTDEMLERYALERDRSLARAGAEIEAHWARVTEMAKRGAAEGATVIDLATRRGGP